MPPSGRIDPNDSDNDDYTEALPSQHMAKYSKLTSSDHKSHDAPPTRTQHFKGPVKISHPKRKMNESYGGDTKTEVNQSSVFGIKKNSH